MLKDSLYNIRDELSRRHRNKEDVFKKAVEERLSKALWSYAEDVEDSVKFLSTKKDLNVLRGSARGK